MNDQAPFHGEYILSEHLASGITKFTSLSMLTVINRLTSFGFIRQNPPPLPGCYLVSRSAETSLVMERGEESVRIILDWSMEVQELCQSATRD